jgi:PRC-barrel domain.
MIRTLLATTALSAALVTGALAQDATTPAQDPAAPATQADPGKPLFSSEAPAVQGADGYFSAGEGQILASGLIGEKIYTSASDDAETIGNVDDVVIGANGTAEAVVVGVGGFLGIGQKNVAVDFDKISWVDRDGDRWLVIQATREELEAAPEFDRTAFLPQETSNDVAMNTPAGTLDPAAPAAPSGDVAATPPADSNQDMAAAPQTEAPATSTETAETQTAPADGSQDMAAAPQTEAPADSTDMAQTQTAPADDATGAVTPVDPAAPASPREGWTVVESGALSADNIMGARVYGADDADLGEISDVIVTADGQFEAFIVDVGGFLGMGEKPIALDATQLQVMRNEDGDLRIFTNYTEDQLKTQTAYTEDLYKSDPNSVILR